MLSGFLHVKQQIRPTQTKPQMNKSRRDALQDHYKFVALDFYKLQKRNFVRAALLATWATWATRWVDQMDTKNRERAHIFY